MSIEAITVLIGSAAIIVSIASLARAVIDHRRGPDA